MASEIVMKIICRPEPAPTDLLCFIVDKGGVMEL